MWNKIRSVFLFQMKLVRANQRILMIFILVAIFIFSNLQGVLEFSQDVGIPVTPWAFPHITSDYICQLVIMAGAVALFCDAPFTIVGQGTCGCAFSNNRSYGDTPFLVFYG